jgi:hypothetical protein
MKQSNDVSYTRDEVTDKLPDWQLITDCIAGQRVVKAAGTTYLPMPNADDPSEENRTRYMQYKQRAVFYNVTRRTHAGLTALAFVEDPTISLPSGLDYLTKDIDGGGLSIKQQMQASLGAVAAVGRLGLLVDYPTVEKPVSQAKLQAESGLRPTICTYPAQSIINWQTVKIGARTVPSLIVLVELYAKEAEFAVELATQWRELRLVSGEGGLQYRVTLYREDAGKHVVFQRYTMQDASGKPLREIPFVCIGSQNNDLSVDDAPMLDLATMNIAHYCNSADYEESVFLCGQPTPTLTGITKDWWENVLNKKVRLGSRSAVPLPAGAKLELVQAEANKLVREAMQDKERQMVALGARLIQSKEVQRTATEARIETASEMSVLSTCANNVAAGYMQAFAWAGQFAGVGGESKIDIHANAEIERLSPEERKQLMAEWQGKAITWGEYRALLRRSGVATEDDETAQEQIDSAKPSYGPGVLGSDGAV